MSVAVYHALVLSANGEELYCCGTNSSGQLGVGDEEPRPQFVSITFAKRMRSVSAGYKNHSFAVDFEGHLWSWGDNSKGQVSLNKKGAQLQSS
jgi:alpha-tubulin suppressor-like RCC1 family protein